MAEQSEVEFFLDSFKLKMSIWGLLFRANRPKNAQTLADLEILKNDVKNTLAELTAQDYSEGPIKDQIFGDQDMWVFGRIIKGSEIYIKITIGGHNNPVICISFHLAEYPMNYPFK